MSWSRSASGTAAAIVGMAASWPQQVADDDAKASGMSDATKQGHAAQVDAAVKVVSVLALVYPDTLMNVHGSGHAQSDGSGNVAVSYTLSKTKAKGGE